jgi:uncharacterized protein (DUF2252 family)
MSAPRARAAFNPQATPAERRREGKSLRGRVPRSAHGGWDPSRRPHDPVEILRASDRGRMERLLPLRYERMLQDPFTFYRATASVMAADLSLTPDVGIRFQICGDAHLLNFGGFASVERRVLFDLNDFDETDVGPWEWDLKRLAVSAVLAGRSLGHTPAQIQSAVAACVQTYGGRMARFARMKVLETWFESIDEGLLLEVAQAGRGRVRRAMLKARKRTGEQVFPKLTREVRGRREFAENKPLVFHADDRVATLALARSKFRLYQASLPRHLRALFERYALVDVAYKVVGVGSVGTHCMVALFQCRGDDPLILQMKEAPPSVLVRFGGMRPGLTGGERVVWGQRLMQASSDLFLGWARSGGRDFYIRQLRDMKVSANVGTMSAKHLEAYMQLCGWSLARAHAKAGGVAPELAGYMGKGAVFTRAVVRFALAYADQAEADHAAVRRAFRKGRLGKGRR